MGVSTNPFSNLVVFEIANNHQGDINHGKKLIDSLVPSSGHFRHVVKFQFRDLDHFIRPGHESKHTKRFFETRLSWDAYYELIRHAKSRGFITMVTPFDEVSVQRMNAAPVDFCKIASCSNMDWLLLNAVAAQHRPIIASTGGMSLSEMDSLVSFLSHRGKDYALNHCVATYPHTPELSGLGMITAMRKRFQCVIGWSGHETPENTTTGQIAYALGARMFETHVALPTQQYPKNAYSRSPDELAAWLKALGSAAEICQLPSNRIEERRQLIELMRGRWTDDKGNVVYQMPFNHGAECVDAPSPIKQGIHTIKALLNEAGVILPPAFEAEYSHHFGAKDFLSVGTTMITIVNREYAKKILVMLPKQWHPKHYHKRKEETFHIIHGDLTVWLDDREFCYVAGQTVLVQPGVWHSFTSRTGCVFEEISTTAYQDDSVYADGRITSNKNRKTKTSNWGRWEIDQCKS